MNIHFTGRHMEVTDAIRTYATEKFDRIYRHYDKITSIQVIFSVEKVAQQVEAVLHIPGGEQIHAHSESEDMYTSIDLLADKIDSQVRKYKDKQKDHRDHRGHFEADRFEPEE